MDLIYLSLKPFQRPLFSYFTGQFILPGMPLLKEK